MKDAIRALKQLLQVKASTLTKDWGEDNLQATDEFSFDVGKVNGIRDALELLEKTMSSDARPVRRMVI